MNLYPFGNITFWSPYTSVVRKYLTWKSFLYSFELECYSLLLVFTQNYSKLVFFGNSILDSLYTRLMKATRVRVSTSVKKEVLVSEYSSEWVLSDHTTTHQRSVEVQFGRYQKNVLQEWSMVKKLSSVSCGSLKHFPHAYWLVSLTNIDRRQYFLFIL